MTNNWCDICKEKDRKQKEEGIRPNFICSGGCIYGITQPIPEEGGPDDDQR
jgi:hypothetical protein